MDMVNAVACSSLIAMTSVASAGVFIPSSEQIEVFLSWHHPNWSVLSDSLTLYSVADNVVTAEYEIGGLESYVNTDEFGLPSGVSFLQGTIGIQIGPIDSFSGLGSVTIFEYALTGNEPFAGFGELSETLVEPATGVIDFSEVIAGTSIWANAEINFQLRVEGTGPLGDSFVVPGPTHFHTIPEPATACLFAGGFIAGKRRRR